ncbi:fasciclin domain-containing protein [Gracilimonas mengyeensis]|uniref:Uncaracterized surface protein containing fasciclin (FAS1) repeats n=1 Tax=Gracilimonas mengyeensis TaxID=1302730 RepID=A0A521E1L3_9BACT|nr:fasciclin domain-containing protein [Gracilimonas mengyeensis]SMO77201.1 Uncaracterized surface protein containing fasciclin (FAS1) repeats [Gracilimonas mengyeensis]
MRTLKKITGVFALMAFLLSTNLQAQDSDIVELAVETEELSTLVTAVQEAGLVETLQSDGPFTVFAPTNEAFAALPEGTLEMLLKPENKDKLTAVLTYHVVPAKVMSGDLKDGMMAETVQGSKATIKLKDGMAWVDGAKVAMADVNASNGVVHVIDKVILPPSIEKALASSDEEKKDKSW